MEYRNGDCVCLEGEQRTGRADCRGSQRLAIEEGVQVRSGALLPHSPLLSSPLLPPLSSPATIPPPSSPLLQCLQNTHPLSYTTFPSQTPSTHRSSSALFAGVPLLLSQRARPSLFTDMTPMTLQLWNPARYALRVVPVSPLLPGKVCLPKWRGNSSVARHRCSLQAMRCNRRSTSLPNSRPRRVPRPLNLVSHNRIYPWMPTSLPRAPYRLPLWSSPRRAHCLRLALVSSHPRAFLTHPYPLPF